MSYISEIFNRLDVQHIREFLLHGVECAEIDTRTYQQRLDESLKPAIEIIRQRFPDMTEYEKITNKIYCYAGACEDVYMEIGIQCGFTLAMQMMANTTPPEKERC